MMAPKCVGVDSQFPLTSDEIRLLAEFGFMAIQAGHIVPALAIFHGLRALRPDHAFSFIGVALTHLARGAVGDAVSVLLEADAVVTVERDDLHFYQALVLSLSGDFDVSEDIFAHLASRDSFSDAQRFFLKKILQKKYLSVDGTPWPAPAKISEHGFLTGGSDRLNAKQSSGADLKKGDDSARCWNVEHLESVLLGQWQVGSTADSTGVRQGNANAAGCFAR